MVNSKGKILAIALGALALFVGGVAVASAAGPVEVPVINVNPPGLSLDVPDLGVMGCEGPPNTCGPG